MRLILLDKKSTKILLISFVITILFFGTLFHFQPMFRKTVISEIKIVKRFIFSRYYGDGPYFEKKINPEYLNSNKNTLSDLSRIETGYLPLLRENIKLTDQLAYPIGAGSLTIADGAILILDRFGGLYMFDTPNLIKLDSPALPNNLKDYVLHSKNLNLDRDSFRTYSFFYDSKNSRLFASYQKYISPSRSRFEVSSISFEPKKRIFGHSWEVIFSTKDYDSSVFGLAGGGKLLVRDDKLYVAVGDYGFYGDSSGSMHAAQDLSNEFGKIFIIDLHKKNKHILSYGHRNTQGMSFLADGSLLNVEQGPQGGDEINLIKDGANYGWPLRTYGTDYGKYTWGYSNSAIQASYQEPLFAFVPSIAVSSIFQVKTFSDRWKNNLLVSSLKAQTLFRLQYSEGRIQYVEPIWIGNRIRDLVELDGNLYLLTDDGVIIILSVDKKAQKSNSRNIDSIYSSKVSLCLSCHHFGQTNPLHQAPSLSNLIGRRAASDNFNKYSSSLKSSGMIWTKDQLREYLINPEKVVPGTTMPKLVLSIDEIDLILKDIENIK
jgi:cytochrome c2